MSDYIVQVKVKNGPLLRAMRRRGLGTAAQLSRAAGVSQTEIGKYLNLKAAPLDRHGMWSNSIIRIAETLNAMPEDLFPPQHIRDPLERNTGEIETALSELSGTEAATAVLPTPENALMDDDLRRAIDESLERLTEREADVIRRRFGMDGAEQTLDEVAAALGVTSRERVRQIEAKGLRKLKHPKNADALKNAWRDYEWKRPRRHVWAQRKESA